MSEDTPFAPSAGWTRETLHEATKLGAELAGHQQEAVHRMLWEVRDVMSTGNDDIGHSGVPVQRIELLTHIQ